MGRSLEVRGPDAVDRRRMNVDVAARQKTSLLTQTNKQDEGKKAVIKVNLGAEFSPPHTYSTVEENTPYPTLVTIPTVASCFRCSGETPNFFSVSSHFRPCVVFYMSMNFILLSPKY